VYRVNADRLRCRGLGQLPGEAERAKRTPELPPLSANDLCERLPFVDLGTAVREGRRVRRRRHLYGLRDAALELNNSYAKVDVSHGIPGENVSHRRIAVLLSVLVASCGGAAGYEPDPVANGADSSSGADSPTRDDAQPNTGAGAPKVDAGHPDDREADAARADVDQIDTGEGDSAKVDASQIDGSTPDATLDAHLPDTGSVAIDSAVPQDTGPPIQWACNPGEYNQLCGYLVRPAESSFRVGSAHAS